MRGEYCPTTTNGTEQTELPPHARRIHRRSCSLWLDHGTTSACAENTAGRCRKPRSPWNYLRMRGEYTDTHRRPHASGELPPHARRILIEQRNRFAHEGTTSACAENTLILTAGPTPLGNYLRMRGEYCESGQPDRTVQELPPHARRILLTAIDDKEHDRTTSACAENTR